MHLGVANCKPEVSQDLKALMIHESMKDVPEQVRVPILGLRDATYIRPENVLVASFRDS